MSLKITDKRKAKVKYEDVQVGQIFEPAFENNYKDSVFIKVLINENTYPIGLKTGKKYAMFSYTEVHIVDCELVILK